ncbi:HNH endonuclease [Thalassotalea eurytherma]|uniref:HNH endonuclease n=1 Tax=Thalassotalea eurytherma TaxID=1144278 RepID=A0ABQ6H2U0_9GAMM|nr:HNH endonuclease [Thalassotalea eurytherma]GLX80736.1 HNH endonuclease [Thalassotalea eurytherma]
MEALYKHQIEFISYMQRLLQEGDFSSTYKFAFLHSLADICIEKDVPSSGQLLISFDEIVDKMITLYWQHATPFIVENDRLEGGVLLQNSGNQAKIITDIVELQNSGARNLSQAKKLPFWSQIHKNTMDTFKKGPLWRLQKLLGDDVCYLFPHIKNRNYIELNSGIADCFRLFHDLIVQFARQGWIEKISKIPKNQTTIGHAGELTDFLFGTSRSSLKSASQLFKEIQAGNCFYCKKQLKGNAEVDHFIPFAKYNNDLGHNFVLAHKTCNNNKRDYLAAPKHRENWQEQNLVLNEKLITNELTNHFTCDVERTIHVANWAYGIAQTNGGKYWLATKDVFV